MKRVGFFLLSVVCLQLVLGETLRADQKGFEEEILRILKEKKIITEEQYADLSHTLAVERKSVNEQILELLKEKEIVAQDQYEVLKEKASEEKKEENKQVVAVPEGLKGVKFKGLWYIDYRAGKRSGNSFNEWNITRGYIDFRKELTPWLSGRVTPDVTRDSSGDFKLRLKYLYGMFELPDFKNAFTGNYIEVGEIHMAWLDFEEHINPYRCQGTMFLERNSIFNSADLGVAFFGYFGGEMAGDYKEKVNDHFAGRFGSYALGVYNGGGYHAGENNENKVFEGRLTVRPFPDVAPGLQLSYLNITGEGNLEGDKSYFLTPEDAAAGVKRPLDDPPDWRVNLAFLSYEHPWYTLVGQYAWVEGSQRGQYKAEGVDVVDERDKEGFSLFGVAKCPWDRRFRLFGRYDYWDPDTDGGADIEQRYLGGLSFDIYKGNMLVLDYEHLDFSEGGDNEHFFQTVLQISY